jgi:hypothetical protein
MMRYKTNQQPHLNDTRTKMASRDLSFRDAFHGNIAEYLQAVTPEEYGRFIGNESIDFDSIPDANQEVLKRLKQAEQERKTLSAQFFQFLNEDVNLCRRIGIFYLLFGSLLRFYSVYL